MPVFGNSIPFWFHGTFLSTSGYWPIMTEILEKGPLAPAKEATMGWPRMKAPLSCRVYFTPVARGGFYG